MLSHINDESTSCLIFRNVMLAEYGKLKSNDSNETLFANALDREIERERASESKRNGLASAKWKTGQ